MEKDLYPKMYLYRRIVQSKLFIDSNYSTAINLDAIADEATFSKFHFMRLFKKTYGKTPHQYLTNVRIGKAKQLLRTTMLASEVCYAVGFDSITSFTSLFKKITGQTPSVFQLQQAARRADIKTKPLNFIPNCFAEMKGWKSVPEVS